MNPRVSRSSRAGLEGDRLPDREDRRPAGGRLRARGDRQRHHAAHARLASSRRSTTSSSRGRASPSRSSPARTATLSTHMQSVGEAMAIGRTFKQAFVKAMRSRELESPPVIGTDEELLEAARAADARPLRAVLRGVRRGVPGVEIHAAPRSTRGSWPRSRRSRARRGAGGRRAHLQGRSTPAPPSSRPRRRTSTRAGSAGRRPRATRSGAERGRRS